MKSKIFFLFLLASALGWGQATLPVLTDALSSSSLPIGFSASGLGSNYSSPCTTALRIDSNGDNVELFFDSTPGQLTYQLKANVGSGSWQGVFIVEQSTNGTTWTNLRTINSVGEISTGNSGTIFTDLPLSTTRYIRWTYTTKTNGNIGMCNVDLHAPICTTPTLTFPQSSITVNEGNPNITTQIATSNSPGTITYSSNNTGVASVNSTSGEIDFGTPGTATITASLAASGTYCAATATYTITVNSTSPSITPTGTITGISTIYGTASTNQNFTFTGANLAGSSLTLNAPAGFEISTSSGGTYGSSLNYTINSGNVNGTVYVRLSGTTNVGTYSGNITLSDGTTNAIVSIPNSSVNPKGLTITGLIASNKEYDGNTLVNVTGPPQYTGLVNGETFAVTGTVSWAFLNANVETNKTLSITGSYNAPSSNYTVNQPSLQASITAKALTVSGAVAQNKSWDGNTNATISGATLVGVISPDVVTVSGGGTFAQSNAGTGIAVTSNLTLGGAAAGNYTLTQPTGLSADITRVAPVISPASINVNVGGTYALPGGINSTSNGTMTFTMVDNAYATLTGGNTINGIAVGTNTLTVNQAQGTNHTAGTATVTVNVTNITYVNGDFRSTQSTGLTYNSGWEYYNGSSWGNPPSNLGPANATVPISNIYINHYVDGGNNASKSYSCNFIINNGGSLYLFDNASNPSTFIGTSKKLEVLSGGLLYISGDIGISTSGQFILRNEANLILDGDTRIGDKIWEGIENFEAGSTVTINSWGWNGAGSGSLINTYGVISDNANGYKFGNLIIDANTTATWTLVGGSSSVKLTENNLEIYNGAADTNFITLTSSSGSNVTINGNLIIYDGAFYFGSNFANGSHSNNYIVNGDFINVSDNLFKLHNNQNTGTATGTLTILGNIEIGSNVTIDNNGNKKIVLESGTIADSEIITIEPTINNINIDIKSGNKKLGQNLNLAGNSSLNILGTSTTNFGTFDASTYTLSGTNSNPLTVNSFGLFKTANAEGFSGTATTSVGNNIATTLQPDSSVEYYANSPQIVTNQVFGTTPNEFNYQNLVISGTGIKSAATGDVIVNEMTQVLESATLRVSSTLDNVKPNVLYAKGGIDVYSVLPNVGNLILENNANLMQNPNAANSGDITLLRDAIVPSNQYNYWASPVSGQNLYDLYDVPANRVMTYNTSNDFFTVKPNPHIAAFGIGYSIKGPASNLPNGGSDTDVTSTFVGTPHNETTALNSIEVTTFDDEYNFNLIGNPYPSNLDLVKMYDELGTTGNKDKIVDETAYFWDNVGNTQMTQQGPDYDQSNYAILNLPSGIGTIAPCTSIDGATCVESGEARRKPTGIIKPGQGFLVDITPGTTFLTVNNEMRTTKIKRDPADDNAVYFKNGNSSFTANDTSKRRDQFWLELVNPNELHIQAAFGYYERAENVYEIYDSKILSETVSENIYSMSEDSIKLAIQGRKGAFNQDDVIPLGVKLYSAGKYKIQLEELKGIFNGHQNIYLKDKSINYIHNLSEDGSYDFEGTPGEFMDRFEIVFKDGSISSGPVLTAASQVHILKRNNQIEISSSIDKILAVEIFNLSGWSVYKNENVNSKILRIPATLFENQIILVKVKTERGEIHTKKFVNK